MNRMVDVAELLGVELDKEFIAKYPNRRKVRCKFRENDFHSSNTGKLWGIGTDVLYDLIMGSCTIHKLPWRAKEDEKYFRLRISDGEIYPETVYEYNPRAVRATYNNGLMCKSQKHVEELAQLLVKTARQFQGFDEEDEDE